MMFLPSSLLVTIFLITSPSLALPAPVADDGMWHPAGVAQTQVTQSTAAVVVTTALANPIVAATTAKAQIAGTATAVAGGDWQTAVTWPAGCEKWANPCPAGAAQVGGGHAATGTGYIQPTITAVVGSATSIAYENGFTSYTTMTDENGVITGMPSKATIAAGVPTTLGTAIKSAARNSSAAMSQTLEAATSSSRPTGFSQASASAQRATGAGSRRVADMAAVLAAAGLVAFLL
ncbi:hypothetical protein EJ08DRAFT_271234 [Tothia fuscella]|uniref:Uncharacterized protein n=1 Tax=Tothia fuscella TaxID=1048955 RepID=A0A9P4NQX3_9PEZI|nr:hypothetical protein EJ08DRAFT_271234 [Tothia fuscella]